MEIKFDSAIINEIKYKINYFKNNDADFVKLKNDIDNIYQQLLLFPNDKIKTASKALYDDIFKIDNGLSKIYQELSSYNTNMMMNEIK